VSIIEYHTRNSVIW